MSNRGDRNVPLLLWPFYAIWKLVTFVLTATGRLVCAILGLALLCGGVVLALTVVGAPIGVPLGLLGFLLLVRAIF